MNKYQYTLYNKNKTIRFERELRARRIIAGSKKDEFSNAWTITVYDRDDGSLKPLIDHIFQEIVNA